MGDILQDNDEVETKSSAAKPDSDNSTSSDEYLGSDDDSEQDELRRNPEEAPSIHTMRLRVRKCVRFGPEQEESANDSSEDSDD